MMTLMMTMTTFASKYKWSLLSWKGIQALPNYLPQCTPLFVVVVATVQKLQLPQYQKDLIKFYGISKLKNQLHIHIHPYLRIEIKCYPHRYNCHWNCLWLLWGKSSNRVAGCYRASWGRTIILKASKDLNKLKTTN